MCAAQSCLCNHVEEKLWYAGLATTLSPYKVLKITFKLLFSHQKQLGIFHIISLLNKTDERLQKFFNFSDSEQGQGLRSDSPADLEDSKQGSQKPSCILNLLL